MRLGSSISAVVTGAGSGLGSATARRLAAHGVKVAVFDVCESAGDAVAQEIGGIFCHVDVTSESSVDAGFAKARERHGQERVLVNCAGILNAYRTASRGKSGEARHFPLDAFDRVIQVNLVGTFRCVAKSAAGMLALQPGEHGERGVIINTASVAAEDGQRGQAAYAASKAAVVGMTLPIARDLMPEGIRVNTILPGGFETAGLLGTPSSVRAVLDAIERFPFRMGDPDEFAGLAECMVTNAYFNGASVRLDAAARMTPG